MISWVRKDESPPGAVAGGVSRYTLAMRHYLARIEQETGDPEYALVQPLMNLVQGRILEYLADRIARLYELDDPDSKTRIATALLGIFQQEFFALFRHHVEQSPQWAIGLARKIIRRECRDPLKNGDAAPDPDPDLLFPAIFHRYFEYRNLDALLALVVSDAEVQRIILLARLKQLVPDRAVYRRIERILRADCEEVCPTVFMRYLREGRIDELVARVRSGAWEDEARGLNSQICRLRGE